MKRLISSANKFLAESCGYFLLLLMLMIAIDVIFRNFGISVFGIIEMGVYLTVAVVYLGLGHCEENDGHVRIAAVVSYLGPSSSVFLRCLVDIASFAIMCVASYGCILSAISSFDSNEAVMAGHIPLYTWPARAAMVIGLVFFCAQILISLKNDVGTFRKTRAISAEQPDREN